MQNMIVQDKKLVTVAQALGVIPMSRSAIYQAIQRGDIPTVLIGRRRFIRSEYLNRLLSETTL